MKLFNIIIITAMLLAGASGTGPQVAGAWMTPDGGNESQADNGLRIRLDIKPASFSGSILFERSARGDESHHMISLSVTHGEKTDTPSVTRSIQNRLKAMRIIARVTFRLMGKTVLALL
jgi:hypothetical protein